MILNMILFLSLTTSVRCATIIEKKKKKKEKQDAKIYKNNKTKYTY